MPKDYEKPEYKSNEEKYQEAVRNAPPPDRSGQRAGDSDHVKMPDVEYKPNVPQPRPIPPKTEPIPW